MANSWRDRANSVITEALEELPREATAKEIRAHLSPRYPFGQRQYTPYKIWLNEVKRAIERRVGVRDERPKSEPRLLLIRDKINVDCSWCCKRPRWEQRSLACFMCADLWPEANRINGNETFQGLARAVEAGDEPMANALLFDWLMEFASDELAHQVKGDFSWLNR